MAFESLSEFLSYLRKKNELHEIAEPLSCELEIAEIAGRVMKRGGPALLFTRVRESTVPLAVNLFGSERRIAWAMGVESVEDKARELAELLATPPPESLIDKIKMIPMLARLGGFAPARVSSAPVQEIVETESPDVLALPVLKCWPKDGGRYITMGPTVTVDPETGKRNVGLYRVQVIDGRTLVMHWQTQKGGRSHFEAYRRLGKKMPVSIVLGGDPATMLSGACPLPPDIDEYLFAGFLRGVAVKLVACKTIPLDVPANADAVIEGWIDPAEPLVTEGPFGEHTGHYSLEDKYPRLHVTAVCRRHDAVYPATVVGRPPMEDAWIGKAVERLFMPIVRKVLPEIVDMNLPAEGGFHNFALVSIRKTYPGQAQKVMHALWGLGQLMFSKVIIVFDDDVNVQDPASAFWRAGNFIDPKRDTTFVRGPIDTLDFASDRRDIGWKAGIDATRKWPEEGFARPWPDEVEMTADVKKKIDALWPKLGLDR